MHNLGHCASAVLASALRNPDSSQQHDFGRALKCVGALVDLSLMSQYRSHTPDTLSYLENYLQTFHQTNDVFLEFRTSKATRAEANRRDRELRQSMVDQHSTEASPSTAANRRRQPDEERVERSYQRANFTRHSNHLNFIKMHYLSHFASHVGRFGSVSMYSTEISELAHKDQI